MYKAATYNASSSRTTPKKCLSRGDLNSHHMVPWAYPSHPKRHLDRFSRFCRAHEHDQQTHRQADHATASVAIGRSTLCMRCCPKMQKNQRITVAFFLIICKIAAIKLCLLISGDYKVEISCFEQPIPGCPFVAQASDISKVVVSNVTTGVVGHPSCFSSK